MTTDDGFVLGYLRCGKEVCFALRRTLDRGATWLALPPPPFSVGAPDDRALFELHFANTFDGWAFGTTLWWDRSGEELAPGRPRRSRGSCGLGCGGSLRSRTTMPSASGRLQWPWRALPEPRRTARWAQVSGAPVGLDVERRRSAWWPRAGRSSWRRTTPPDCSCLPTGSTSRPCPYLAAKAGTALGGSGPGSSPPATLLTSS